MIFSILFLYGKSLQSFSITELPWLGVEYTLSRSQLSNDGTVVITNNPFSRLRLKDQTWLKFETTFIALQKGKPPKGFSRTTSQNLIPLKNDSLLQNYQGIDIFSGPEGINRVLIAKSFIVNQHPIVGFSEIRFDVRGERPNLDWVINFPKGQRVYATDLRFVDAKTNELWVVVIAKGQNQLRSYTTNRLHPELPVRAGRSILLRNLKRAEWGTVVSHSLNLANHTYVADIGPYQNTHYALMTFSGKVLKTFDPNQNQVPYDENPDLTAVWMLTVADQAIPGGRAKWKPVTVSENKRFWLLKDATTGAFSLLDLGRTNESTPPTPNQPPT